MQKIISLIFAALVLLAPVGVFAQTTTLLPAGDDAEECQENCRSVFPNDNAGFSDCIEKCLSVSDCEGLITGGDTGFEATYADGKCLAEKIQTGKIHYRDIPYIIGHIIKFLLSVGWALAVVMIIYGGYQYVLGGFGAVDKEKGKKTLIYSVAGLAVATFAWFMVDTFIAFITS